MKVYELITEELSRARILSVLGKLKSLGLEFTVIGGAGFSLHAEIPTSDVDIVLLHYPADFFEKKLDFYDYPLSPAGHGLPRHVRIDGIPVHLIHHGDLVDFSKVEQAPTIRVHGFATLSLPDLIKFTTDKKRQEKLELLIKAKKLPMKWFKNLDRELWRKYAVAWDSVHDVPVEQVERWKKLFDTAHLQA